MKYLADQFQLFFFNANTKLLYIFLHFQHNWQPYFSRQLATNHICVVVSLHSGI